MLIDIVDYATGNTRWDIELRVIMHIFYPTKKSWEENNSSQDFWLSSITYDY